MMNDKIQKLIDQKQTQHKITMLTAYDILKAQLVDQAGVDIVLVGDSLAQVVLGLESTKDVTLQDMLHHLRAVRRGVARALLVVDMPFVAYQVDPQQALDNARTLCDEGGADAVKVEWFDQCLAVVESLQAQNISVMGHVGLTPQRVDELGGYKVQGRDEIAAAEIMNQAQRLEEAGCFSIVLECVPYALAKQITNELNIPTIGIGAGPACDGQVLVIEDLLGFVQSHKPRFVKHYANSYDVAVNAVQTFLREVQSQQFPDAEHSYGMADVDPQRGS